MARSTVLPPAAWNKWVKEGKPRQFLWRGKVQVPLAFMFEEENQDKPAVQVAKVEETALQKLQDRAIALWEKEQSNARELGKTLVEIRDKMGYGEFGKWWKEKKLDQNRVSYCMRLVEGKVADAKAKAKGSPRTKAVADVTKDLRKLYDLANADKEDAAKQLLEKIIRDIKERFFKKPLALAASNGA
jgi:hypothetical protein